MPQPAHKPEVLIEALELVRKHGSVVKASEISGINRNTLQNRFTAARDRMPELAARYGFARGHFEQGVAPGYLMGKVTVTRNKHGEVDRTWERMAPEADAIKAIENAIDRRIERIKPLPPVKPPKTFGPDNTFNQVSIFDGHIGAHAWGRETGSGNWDLKLAREHLTVSAAWLLDNLPAAQDCLVMIGGDFTEVDGYKPLTPEHGHLLDADGRYPLVFEVAEDVIEATVLHALRRYRHVHLTIRPGNHDKQTAFALRRVFMRVFRENPRVFVDESLREYWAMEFGRTMICCHHGDKARLNDLPGIFASDFAPMWGRTSYRICHSGHWHHEKTVISRGVELTGMTMYQHPTMERRNAWAAGKGLIAARQLVGHSYHVGGALITQLHFNPEIHGLGE